ncbi:MAG: hypothetical protein KGM16_19565 [Bacteroidota bacterium]|nr:hypothetical protein [Bacteroidota bacterium]
MVKKNRASKKTQKVFIYFNNDIGCNAVKNAAELKVLVEKK